MSARGPSIAPRTSALAPLPALADQASLPDAPTPPAPVTSIVTSREWVLPPRPKPGRKPSVDTPALKRKAQNRAAQRAFRERRATRVQELEAKLLEVEKEKEVKEMGLVSTINKLKFENLFLLKSVDQLKNEFAQFRALLGQTAPSQSGNSPPKRALLRDSSPGYAADVSQSAQHLLNFAKLSPVNHNQLELPASLQYSVQQILPAPLADSPPLALLFRPAQHRHLLASPASSGNTPQRPRSKPAPADNNPDFDCGVCLKDQCLCEEVGIKEKHVDLTDFTPMPAVLLKRKLPDSAKLRETDFTKQYATKKMPDLKRLRSNLSAKVAVKREPETVLPGSSGANGFNEESPLENCGFCSDGTPCVCREAAQEAARLNESLQQKPEENDAEDTLLPPLQLNSGVRKQLLPVMHPGPTLEIREFANLTPGAVPTVVLKNDTKEKEDGCTGNPGTCAQCQTDPMLTLFCTTVALRASERPEDASGDTGDTGDTGANGDKTTEQPDYFAKSARTSDSQLSLLPSRPLSISQTNPPTPLPTTPGGSSSGIFIPCADAYRTLSRHKRFNSVDFTALVGKLTTRGMQVEVQSVANVLRELDRKVYD